MMNLKNRDKILSKVRLRMSLRNLRIKSSYRVANRTKITSLSKTWKKLKSKKNSQLSLRKI